MEKNKPKRRNIESSKVPGGKEVLWTASTSPRLHLNCNFSGTLAAVAAPSAPRQDDAVQALAAACQDPLDDQAPPLHPCVEGLAYRDGA